MVQNFAQYAGLIIYDRWSLGDLQTKTPQVNYIRNQLNRMDTAADSSNNMFEYFGANSCSRRWDLTPLVDARSGTVLKRSAPFVVPRSTGIEVVPVPEVLVEAPVTNCTIGESV